MTTTDKRYTAPAGRDAPSPEASASWASRPRPAWSPGKQAALPELEVEIAAAEAAIGRCPVCKGSGWLRRDVPVGHPHFGKPEKCQCRLALERAKRKREIMSLSGLGGVRDKTIRNFNVRVPGVQQAARAARDYAASPVGWLVLLGPVGCGKTHLAAAIANDCFDRLDLAVLFVTVSDLLDHLRATFEPSSAITYDEQFSRMRDAELLVLDDLGAHYATDWAREKLFQLLNYRYNQAGSVDERTGRSRAMTVVTSNLFGLHGVEERIRSRLTDTAISQVVSFGRDVGDYRPRLRPKTT
jgi:DNA replication protein DnaC